MDKLRELRAQLNRFRNSSVDEQTRADCFRADWELELFENFLSQKLEFRDTRMCMVRHHTVADFPTVHDPPIPQLFHNNTPISRLFLRDINYRIRKNELREVLIAQDCEDFEIESLKHTKTGTVATISCKSLASSCKIQVKACKKELIFTDPKGKISYIKTRPDQFVSQNTLRPTHVVVPKPTTLPPNLTTLFSCPEVVNHIFKFVSTDDIFRFYSACFESQEFLRFDLTLDSSADRYNHADGLNLLLEDARKLRFRYIIFREKRIILETPFVNKLLEACIRNQANPDRRLGLQLLDLSAVTVSSSTIKMLSESCSIHQLILGNTPGGCDEFLELEKLRTLICLNNAKLSLKCLSKDCFSSITSLKIIGCNEVPMNHLFNFVICNAILRELVFKDSLSRNRHSVDLLIAVFSGSNYIEIFHFNYSTLRQFRSHLIPQMSVNQSSHLKILNLENNGHFKNWIPSLINNAPNLIELNLLGLEFDYPLSLNTLTSLRSLRLNYNQSIEASLGNITSKFNLDIVVNNSRGKKRTRAINLTYFRDLVLKSSSTSIKFINCKFVALRQSQRAFKSEGILLKESENSVIIYKC